MPLAWSYAPGQSSARPKVHEHARNRKQVECGGLSARGKRAITFLLTAIGFAIKLTTRGAVDHAPLITEGVRMSEKKLAGFVIQARNAFESQCSTHGAPMGRAQLAAFNNAITPLCVELEEAWAALADMTLALHCARVEAEKNAQAAADLAELNRRFGRKVFGGAQ